MAVSKIEFNCPSCGKKNRIKINDVYTESDLDRLLSKELFKIECSKCNGSTILEYPFTYVGENYALFYNTKKTVEKDIMRDCISFDDLKEKILIFNDSLNDVIIEYIKLYIDSELKKEKIFSDIRYDSSDEENLKFYVVNKKEYAQIPYSFYNELIKKGKLKTIKGSAKIDVNTCLKYFHL